MERMFLMVTMLISLYLISLINLNRNKCKEIKANIRLKEYEINMNLNIGSEILTELDNIIDGVFLEYITLNIEYRELEYITPEIEDIIFREVTKKVVDSLSPVFFDKFALVYNKNNFSDFISKRVYLYTLNYTLAKNAVKDEEEKK